jgi:predicted dehydrogenase
VSAPLRWGILGTGGIVRRWLPGFRTSGDTLAIVGSRDPARARSAAAEFGAERGGSYEDVLAAADVDVIYNALPNQLHVEWTIRAAEAGKPSLCEKPLAPTVEGCQQMVAAAERHGVALVEAFMYRYHPRWARVRQLIDEGRIGPVRFVRAVFGYHLGPDRAGDVCGDILSATGLQAAVVDANDLGNVDVVGATPDLPNDLVEAALRKNPAGNADETTPIVLIRPV